MAIGRATAGADIVVSDISESAANAVADEVRTLGRKAIAVTTDVSDRAQVKVLADAACTAFGRVDILCNNAGVALDPMRPIWQVAYEDVRWMINVSLWGMLNGVYAFLPRMMAQPGRKHIVNTSSRAPFTPVLGSNRLPPRWCPTTIWRTSTDASDPRARQLLHRPRGDVPLARAPGAGRRPAHPHRIGKLSDRRAVAGRL